VTDLFNGKTFRGFLGSILLAVSMFAFVNNHVIHQYVWHMYEVGMIIGFGIAGVTMVNRNVAVTVARIIAKFIPGANKRVSGQTVVNDKVDLSQFDKE